MDVLDELRALNKRPGPSCGWKRAMEQLPEKDQEQLTAALLQPDITHGALSRWLQTRSIKIGISSIGHHRKGDCSCPKS